MGGEFRMEVALGNTRYSLNRAACEALLAKLEEFGDACGHPCQRLREDLREALARTAPDGREAEVAEEQTFRFKMTADAADGAEAVAEGGAPRCFWCGEPGEELPTAPGDTEPLFGCRTAGCPQHGRPKAREWFGTGRH